jgi:hypothetical protein
MHGDEAMAHNSRRRSDTEPLFNPHPPEELLELYSLGMASQAELTALEEHLLTCSDCQTRLEDAEAFIVAIRFALRELQK